jgi:hypothetical protein
VLFLALFCIETTLCHLVLVSNLAPVTIFSVTRYTFLRILMVKRKSDTTSCRNQPSLNFTVQNISDSFRSLSLRITSSVFLQAYIFYNFEGVRYQPLVFVPEIMLYFDWIFKIHRNYSVLTEVHHYSR